MLGIALYLSLTHEVWFMYVYIQVCKLANSSICDISTISLVRCLDLTRNI